MRTAIIEIEYTGSDGQMVTEAPRTTLRETPVAGIVDNNGRKVTYRKVGNEIVWSSNVTPDIEEIGKAMILSPTAMNWLDKMDKAPHKIYLELSVAILPGRDFAVASKKPNRHDPLNKIDYTKIVIQKGKLLAYIAKYQSDMSLGYLSSNLSEQEELYEKLSAENDIEALIAANVGHEAVHASDPENIKQDLLNSFRGTNYDVEALPEQVETQILKEIYALYEKA